MITTSSTYIFTTEPYGSITTDSQISGTGTYYIHVQAKDAADNTSTVTTASAILNNTAPTLSIGAPSVSYANSSTQIDYTITYTGAQTITLAVSDISWGANSTNCSASILVLDLALELSQLLVVLAMEQ
jgi:hypothetical protein